MHTKEFREFAEKIIDNDNLPYKSKKELVNLLQTTAQKVYSLCDALERDRFKYRDAIEFLEQISPEEYEIV